MAELSDETKAIIERLKAEGQLIRNTGTNSIRSVKIQLDRFESVFNSINDSLLQQTSLLQTQAGLYEDAAEAERRRRDFDELRRRDEDQNRQTQDVSPDPSGPQGQRQTESILKALVKGGLLSNLIDLGKLGLYAGGAYVLFEFVRGFVDSKTDGGMTNLLNFIGDVAWPTLTTQFNNLIAKLPAMVTNLEKFFKDPIGTILTPDIIKNLETAAISATAGLTALAGLGALSRMAQSSGVAPIDVPPAGGGRNVPGRGLIGKFGLGLAALGVYMGGEYLKDYIIGDGPPPNWQDDKLSKFAVEGIDFGQNVMMGASIGSMFGPKGMLIGAVLGGAISLGFTVVDWLEGRDKAAKEALEARLRAAQALADNENDVFKELLEKAKQKGLNAAQILATSSNELLNEAANGSTEAIKKVLENAKKVVGERLTAGAPSIETKIVEQIGRIFEEDGLTINKEVADSMLNELSLLKDAGTKAGQASYGLMFQRIKQDVLQGASLNEIMSNPEFKTLRSFAQQFYGSEGTKRPFRTSGTYLTENAGMFDVPYQTQRYRKVNAPRDQNGNLIMYDELGNPVPLTYDQARGNLGNLLQNSSIIDILQDIDAGIKLQQERLAILAKHAADAAALLVNQPTINTTVMNNVQGGATMNRNNFVNVGADDRAWNQMLGLLPGGVK